MDVAQMITSAAALPALAETSSGASAASPLFREMFSKAALAAGVTLEQQTAVAQSGSPGSLLVNSTGAGLAVQVLALSGGEVLPEQGAQGMSGVAEGQLGTLIARAMAHRRQAAGENATAPEQRGLSLHKGRENKGEVKADLSERQLETELFAGAEILLTVDDVTTRENKAEGSDSDGSTQEIPRQTRADGAGNSALATLPAALESVPVSMPVERNISLGFAAESKGASTVPVLPEELTAVAYAVNEPVRGAYSSVPIADGAWKERRPAGLEVVTEQVSKHVGSVTAAMEQKVVSHVQSETTGVRNIFGKEGDIPAANTELSSFTAEVAGTPKTAGLEVSSMSPDGEEMAQVIPNGEKLVGKDHGNIVRHENGPAAKHAQYEQKPDGKGETVPRELPSGVTVLNPAQTLTMGPGRPALAADAVPLAVQGTERGRIFPQEGEIREEQGRQISLTGEGEKIARKAGGFSSQNNSNLGHDSTPQGGNHALPQTAAASGPFATVAKGQLEPLYEAPREHEVSELHQNILSQVREKLLIHEPSGTVSKISLKLNPHELGELQINVRLEDQKMRVEITAQNPVVKEALLQNIDQLKDTLMRQNISMERFHVSTGDGGQSFNQSFREGRQASQQTPDAFRSPLSGYYQEDQPVSQAAYADTRENSLVDMRF